MRVHHAPVNEGSLFPISGRSSLSDPMGTFLIDDNDPGTSM